jgi:hypothetical protein
MGVVIGLETELATIRRLAATKITGDMDDETRLRIYEAQEELRVRKEREKFVAAVPGYLASIGMVAVPEEEWEALRKIAATAPPAD